ncbi:MAG: tRNA (N6-isopentenyl adenosine(37)-C2)-methylthiotransferase MiaB [Clostridia bacterium]|nr:tRNA (N6-isopentenyl adenosine(37)-C2)-methylthiotransferase MiaB [Clostridia bacterium]
MLKHEVSKAELLRQKSILKSIYDANYGHDYRYHIESYGCQMNNHDSERIAGMLNEAGYRPADSKNDADIIIFNTCCVREHAELRVFGNVGALKALKDEKPFLIIGVCGCMMQQEQVAKKLSKRYPFVDLIFGTHELFRLPEMLESVLSGDHVFRISGSDADIAEDLPIMRNSTFSTNVNIMFGCNNFCTYCIVPYVRGRERSRSAENIVGEVKKLAAAGYLEITLLGQNVNSYNAPDSGIKFPGLLALVNDIDGVKRIRFMTSHPKDLSDELIYAMRDLDKVCHHIHLPVQSGSSRILREMNRRYTREDYLRLIDKLRANMPDIDITTDIIVGFPGETDADFEDTISLVDEVGYCAAYTFMYSQREGTIAAKIPDQIPPEIKKERLHALNAKVASKLSIASKNYINKIGEVLVEGCDQKPGGMMVYGKMNGFRTVFFPGDESLIGKMIHVKIIDTLNTSLVGQMVK